MCRSNSRYQSNDKLRVMPALHEDLNPARGRKFVQFLVELLAAEHIVIFVFFGPIKRAEFAVNVADVGVIDVAIDDVGHDLPAALVVAGLLRQIAARIGQSAQRFERPVGKARELVRPKCVRPPAPFRSTRLSGEQPCRILAELSLSRTSIISHALFASLDGFSPDAALAFWLAAQR